MFKDRKDAGKRLAEALDNYKDSDILVLAIPRGGVEVGYEVAKYLNADFDIIVTRKLPYPTNPEAGFGAIAEDGSFYINESASKWLTNDEIRRIKQEQNIEIKRRVAALRQNRPLPGIKDRNVILIDDGIAMGSTMRASIMLCKNKMAKKIIVAVPVSGKDTADDIRNMVDEIVILETPSFFQAVAQVYDNWHDVNDDEVLDIMDKWESFRH